MAIDGVTLKDNKVTANGGLVADNITIDGTEIDLSSGDLTLDVAGDIILDADGADVSFRDDGTGHLSISNSSNDAVITSLQSDKDMIFKGVDGGSLITALTLDMSAAGKALFNSGAAFSGNVDFADNAKIVVGSGDDLQIYHDGSHNYILSNTSDQDIIFKGNDGGSAITAVTLDMSDAGHATFNNQITSGSHIIIPATSRLYLDGSGDTFISEVAANAIAFTTGNSERMRISSDGLHLGGTGSANALDDYEEGTWTPAWASGFYAENGYLNREGFYTKVGRLVTCQFSFRTNTSGWTSNGNQMTISGVPFTMLDSEARAFGISSFHSFDPTAVAQIYGNNNSTVLQLYKDGDEAFAQGSNHTAASGKYFIGGFSFITA